MSRRRLAAAGPRHMDARADPKPVDAPARARSRAMRGDRSAMVCVQVQPMPRPRREDRKQHLRQDQRAADDGTNEKESCQHSAFALSERNPRVWKPRALGADDIDCENSNATEIDRESPCGTAALGQQVASNTAEGGCATKSFDLSRAIH